MLVDFSVKNFLCFNDKQTLSLIKGPLRSNSDKEKLETHIIQALDGKQKLTKSAVIYGANASGKSSLLKAIDIIKTYVLTDKYIIVSTPFLFVDILSPTIKFEISFIIDQVYYEYSLSIQDFFVASEKLRKTIIDEKPIELIRRDGVNKQDWFLNPILGNDLVLKAIVEATPQRGTILSKVTSFDLVSLDPIVSWFKSITIINGLGINFYPPMEMLEVIKADENAKQETVDMLNQFDLSICDILVREKEINISFDRELIKDKVIRTRNIPTNKVSISHLVDNKTYTIPLEDESDGTRKLFSISKQISDAVKNGHLVIIDEIDAHLHTMIVQQLITYFHSKENKQAQLVFTTHDTNCLNAEIFCKDQVWFCEKKADQSTDLFSLSDFNTRSDNRANWEKQYLDGLYGGIPILAGIFHG